MKKIICFMEQSGEMLERFLQKYEEKYEIHLYTDIIESCENNLFYCMGELFNIVWQTQDKCQFVTDIPGLRDIVADIFEPFIDKIEFVSQNVTSEFTSKLDIKQLLEYEIGFIQNYGDKKVIDDIWQSRMTSELPRIFELSESIRMSTFNQSFVMRATLIHICKTLLYVSETKVKDGLSSEMKLFVLSVMMKYDYNAQYTNRYLREVASGEYNADNLYFIWNQFKCMGFRKLAMFDDTSRHTLDMIYEKAYQTYMHQVDDEIIKINKNDRDKEMVVVFTIQFLEGGHAPTRSVIERCKALRALGKNVVLINTTEEYTAKGIIPIYDPIAGNVIKEYDQCQTMQFGDETYPFIQLPSALGIIDKFDIVKQIIYKLKPSYILNIGSGSMLADMCGDIVPCASMSLVFSSMPHTVNTIPILGRLLSEAERNTGKYDNIIESRFTFELKAQRSKYDRQQYGMPEDKFVLVLVGIRLDHDITPELLAILNDVCNEDCYVVFAGKYESYDNSVKAYPNLMKNSSFIGYCDDMLALMEICDLYVNPVRAGGGFSIIEAFAKGVPGVYLKMGDVYAAGGEEFAVNTLDEMKRIILKYKDDREFYDKMSATARQRAILMTDSVKAIGDIDRKICERICKGEFYE